MVALLRSSDSSDRLACTAILSALVDMETLEEAQKTRMAMQLKSLLNGTDLAVSQEAVKIYSRLINKRWAMVSSSMEAEVKRSLEWLGNERNDVRRMTAVLILEASCKSAPSAMYSYAYKVLTALTPQLRDHRSEMRVAAARALGSCLVLISSRDTAVKNQWYNYLYEEMGQGQPELIEHGSMFMRAHFGDISELVMRLKDQRDQVVRRSAIAMLPVLARYSPGDFVKYTVNGDVAFAALGNVALNCKAEFRPYIEHTTRAIRDVLIQRYKSGVPPSTTDETSVAVLETIARLAQAMGPAMTRYLRELLDLMFTTGLSTALCDSLAIIATEVSQLARAIQDRLLDMVSIILVGVPFRPTQPGIDTFEARMGSMSLHYSASANPANEPAPGVHRGDPTSLVVSAATNTNVTPDVLVLALNTLSSFDFSQENLSEFVRNDVLQYLTNSYPEVRMAAINAVSHIVLSDPLYQMLAGAGVERFTDIEADVRLMAVRMLEQGSCFDFHMGKAQNIQSLFLLLNDEVFEVRLKVLAVIGRLANMNPAHVMPSLRRMVVQLLTELEYAHSNAEREECIELLMMLVSSAENWVRPYVGDIFKTILPRMDDASPQLSSKFLDTVAALARVGGSDLVPHLDRLLASIIQALGDQSSSQKRLSALKALSNCATFCGLVITPFVDQPTLFSTLIGMLKSDPNETVQLEVLRVIGALGAIDPHKYTNGQSASSSSSNLTAGTVTKKSSRKKSGKHGKRHGGGGPAPNVMETFVDDKSNEMLDGDLPLSSYGTTFSNDSYYATVSVGALLRILDDPADATFHRQAAQALISMFGPLQNSCQPYLASVVPAILKAMDAAPADQAQFYIENLGLIVAIAKELVRPYIEPVFELFEPGVPISAHQQTATIGLIEVLAEALSGDFGRHISTVLPFLITVIDNDKNDSRHTTQRALHALRILSPSLDGYLFLVMPRLIALLDPSCQPLTVVEGTLETISSVVSSVNCRSFASRIVLTLVRLLQRTPSQTLQTAVMDTFCAMMQQLQDDFTLYMPTINATMQTCGIVHHEDYGQYSRLLFSGRLIPKDPQRVQPMLQVEGSQPEAPLGQAADSSRRLRINVISLRRAWSTTQQRVTKEDWLGWLNQFGVELLQQSPSPALRACSNLAFKHPRLNSDLFNAAFVSCWTELTGQYQQEIITALQDVASNEKVPADILQTILSLAEYMERDEKQIPIDLKLLGEYADRCHALAKELHYKEAEWTLENNYETVEKLIELNQSLDQHDAAVGMLNYVRKEHPEFEESVEWYFRLHRWDEALAIVNRQEHVEGHSYSVINMKLRCLYEMSDWDRLVPLFNRVFHEGNNQMHMAAANIGVNMSWALGDVEGLEKYTPILPKKSRDRTFSEALIAVYRNKIGDAAEAIKRARGEMENEFASHLTESYSRGYTQMFRCQMLTELEEVIEFKAAHDNRERQMAITNTWRQRMQGVQRDVGMWQRLLRLHSMVLRPVLDLETWIKFINLDEAKYMDETLRGDPETLPPMLVQQAHEYARLKEMNRQKGLALDISIRQSQQPALVYAYLKYQWADNRRRDAFQGLDTFTTEYAAQLRFDVQNPHTFIDQLDAATSLRVRLLARFFFKKAEWLTSIQQNANLVQEAKSKAALGADDSHYLPQRFDRRGSVSRRSGRSIRSPEADRDAEFLSRMKVGPINEVILKSYQAATVLDRKWYKAWHSLALRHYYETQKIDSELSIVPENVIEKHVVPAVHGFFRAIQLSKSDTTLQDTLRLLTVWFNYSQHSSVAQAVLDGFNTVSIRTWLQVIPQILARIHIKSESTSRLIQQLLVEVGKFHPHAILFSLYVAARSNHTDRSHAAKDVLHKLHDLTPELVEETEVVSRELIRVTLLFPEMCRDALDIASKHYYGQNDPVSMIKVLKPFHQRARNPETLREYHFVQMFANELAAADEYTTQYMAGEPGRRNEALIQQAWEAYYVIFRRIEKLFPEPTSLALKDTAPTLLECRDMHLAVPGTYDPDRPLVRITSFDPVVHVYNTKQHPRRVGIFGSDGKEYTFVLKGHEDLRQDERVMQLFGLITSLLARDPETARRALTIERYPTMHEVIRDYRDSHNQPLNLEQRMAMQFSPNWETLTVMQKRAMWYKSPNAETWLERRTTYTRSMAVMSIAGYILGLGDRHPSNIMLHQRSGKAVHIDFGDCFEIASQREKYPETGSVSSIEGSFKFTANHTMRVLRANRDSLMAVLEAFVFDPLVSWSYIQDPESNTNQEAANGTGNVSAQQKQQNQAQLKRWNMGQGGSSNAIEGGSRPDEKVTRAGKTKMADFAGLDDKGWQVGNPKAKAIVNRISSKLLGTDFDPNVQLTVAAQIDKLIQQATSSENLAVLYPGWVPLW
ncbi:ARM repeat-containing protein [Linderina pennispora]|uniref:Serine/threonine-protein kinase TOR n=1 Tax=Linderina pennispora TaxID=61395 RepID=A0A1Y1WJ35_9FUNG|nr:ARM repeat-containing protein [Linderina pennispora]ORX73348.1 ARM repeat-containing protein [Linderina pennispora]